MATIVTPSDFKGMIMLPQINAPVNIGVSVEFPVSADLQSLIDDKEPEVLTKLLGYSLYKAFIAGLAEDPIPQKWADLKNGAEYTDQRGNLQKYLGIKPIISRFVYYWYLRQQATQTTGVGESSNKTENAIRTSPNQKQATAWNDMVKAVKSCYAYLHDNVDLYPEAPDFRYCGNRFSFDRWYYEGYYRYWRRCDLLTVINTASI